MTESTTADAASDDDGGLWVATPANSLIARGASCCVWCVARIFPERARRSWAVLLTDEAVHPLRLADLFLELVIDRDNEFAFVRNAPSEDAPKAVRSEALTFLDTAMLLVLRQTLLSEEGRGRVIVGQAEVFEQLAVFRTPDRDEKDFASRVNSSWNKMQNKLRVLHAVGDDRAEISPVLRLLVDADQIRAITSSTTGSPERAEENPLPRRRMPRMTQNDDAELPHRRAEVDPTRPGQWRLAQIELVNWGTFAGHVSVDVARAWPPVHRRIRIGQVVATRRDCRRPHPRQVAAPQRGGSGWCFRQSDRTLMSYVRGAWSKEADETADRATTTYLRSKATWSGILLRYENLRDEPVVLLRVFHAPARAPNRPR
jgi:hypothetical protein